MQPITVLGLAIFFVVLLLRMPIARRQPPSSPKQRLKTAHLLVGALVVWLVINFELQHLNRSISGEAPAPQSTWERIVYALSDWGI